MKPPSDDIPTTSAGEGTPAATSDAKHDANREPLNEIEAFRAQELLLLRATEGLSEPQLAELASLGSADDDSYDLAAAAVDLATLPRYELPSDVAQRLLLAAGVRPPRAATEAPSRHLARAAAGAGRAPSPSASPPASTQASSHASPPASPPASPQASPSLQLQLPVLPSDRPVTPLPGNGRRPLSSSGTTSPIVPRPSRAPRIAWTTAAVAVAASALFAVWTMRQPAKTIVERVEVPVPATPAAPRSPAEARAQLLATAADVQTLPWTLTADPASRGASGDVVWSPSKQEGYLRFVGLAANDPKLMQYQLWIFDKLRDERYPVDGGVFDVASVGPDGELIVAIRAKLPVGEPVLFAVTVEPPGGVVVSQRERIVVTAAPAKAG